MTKCVLLFFQHWIFHNIYKIGVAVLDLWKMSPISPYFQLFSFYISQSNKGEVTFQKAIREMSEKNFGNIVYISALMMMI